MPKHRKLETKDFLNPNSFFQIDLMSGFSFYDHSGELLNKYEPIATYIDRSAEDGTLLIHSLKNKVTELKVNSKVIWARFENNFNLPLNTMLTTFNKEYKNINSVLKVERIRRIGWRNHFIYKYPEDNFISRVKGNLSLFSNLDFVSSVYTLSLPSSYKGRVIIQQVQNKEGKGLLLDIDLYRVAKGGLEASKIKQELINIEEIINQEMLVFMNEIIEKVNEKSG